MDKHDELIQTRALRRRWFFLLAGWAALSWVAGLVLLLADPLLRSNSMRLAAHAAAAQCIIWGLLDTSFALFGLRQAQRADRARIDRATIARELADRDRLLRVLHFSARLSAALVAMSLVVLGIGIALRSAPTIGHSCAMLVQSVFLLLYDRVFLAGFASVTGGFAAGRRPDNSGEAIDAFSSGR